MTFAICDGQDAQVIDMMMALYQEDPGTQVMTPAKARATLEHLQNHPERGRVFTLTYGGEPVGYLLLLWYWSNEYGGLLSVVDELYIRPQWRRHGFARKTLKWVERQPEIKGVMLEVTPHNEGASELYRQCGFVDDENRHFFKPVASDPRVSPPTTAPADAPAMRKRVL